MSATRQELLGIARQYPAVDGASLEVAASVASEESIATNEVQLKGLIGKNDATFKLSKTVAILGFSILMSLVVLLRWWWHASTAVVLIPYLGIAVTFMATAWTCIVAEDRATDARKRLAKLSPLAGSDQCEDALHYIESGYPAVRAWRDLALAERGQLYGFDVAIMKALYCLEEVKRASAERQRRNQEACRKLHGIGAADA